MPTVYYFKNIGLGVNRQQQAWLDVSCELSVEVIRRYLYLKFSFGEVYHRIYGRKFSFTATHEKCYS